MKLRLIVLLFILLVSGNYTFAAFPLEPTVSQSSTVTDNNRIICDYNPTNVGDTIIRKTSYRNQYHKPYHNREKEAKLAFTFGLLGILVFPIFGIPALILGIMSADKRNKYYSRAKWGIIMGAYSTLMLLLVLVLVIVAVSII